MFDLTNFLMMSILFHFFVVSGERQVFDRSTFEKAREEDEAEKRRQEAIEEEKKRRRNKRQIKLEAKAEEDEEEEEDREEDEEEVERRIYDEERKENSRKRNRGILNQGKWTNPHGSEPCIHELEFHRIWVLGWTVSQC